MASEAILGPNTLLLIFALFSPGMVPGFWFTSRLHICTHGDKCPLAVSSPCEWREGATHTSRLEFCLVFCLNAIQARMCGLTALKIWSFSGLSSFLLRPERDIRVGMICTDDTRTSRLQAKGRRPYLSQNMVQQSPGLPDLFRHPCLRNALRIFTTWTSLFNKYECIHGCLRSGLPQLR